MKNHVFAQVKNRVPVNLGRRSNNWHANFLGSTKLCGETMERSWDLLVNVVHTWIKFVTCMDQLTCCHFGSTQGLKVFLQQQIFRKHSIVMSMEQQLRDLAQTHLEHIQDFRLSDLRRAVVLHLENMGEQDMVLQHKMPTRDVCPHILQNTPCPKWHPGSTCAATWHPEFVQVLEDGVSKWTTSSRRPVHMYWS